MTLPHTLDAAGLARLLHLSESTILRDVTRKPESLPPFITVRKKKIWVTLVVLDWIKSKCNRQFDVDLRQLISSQTSPCKPSMPSLGEMLEAANNSTLKRGKK